MRSALPLIAAASLLAACGTGPGPTEEEEQLDTQGSAPEVVAHPPPGDPALREGPVTPAERNGVGDALRNGTAPVEHNEAAASTGEPSSAEAAAAVVERFGALIEERRFAEARELWADAAAAGLPEEAFAEKFEGFETIDSAVESPQRIEGAAGSLYADVQLTLTGTLDSGEPYSRTGVVTVKRSNEVPGATAEQLQWRIVKVRLGPGAAA